jgi:hypothetical protein
MIEVAKKDVWSHLTKLDGAFSAVTTHVSWPRSRAVLYWVPMASEPDHKSTTVSKNDQRTLIIFLHNQLD